MTRRAALAALVLVPASLLAGCKTQEGNNWLGAGIGATAGALAGHAIGGRKHHTAGTIIGAVVGGVAGYAIAGGFGSSASDEERRTPAFQQANDEFNAGVAAKNSGNSQAAMDHYNAASRLTPDQPEPYNNAGLIYLEQGDRANAEANFRKALAVDPGFQPARTNLERMGVSP